MCRVVLINSELHFSRRFAPSVGLKKMKVVVFQYNPTNSMQFFALIPNMCLVLLFSHVIVEKMSEYMSNFMDYYGKTQCSLAERYCPSI